MVPVSETKYSPSQQVLFFLQTLLATAFTIFLVRRSLRKRSSPSTTTARAPPGPWKLPIIGNLHQLLITRTTLPHRRLWELSQRHGPAVMHLQLGEVSTVVVSSPEAARQVMQTHDVHTATRPVLLAPTIVFYGCKDVGFAPYGEYWRQMRQISIRELLGPKRVRALRSLREEEVSNLVTRISLLAAADGPHPPKAVDLTQLLVSLGNRISCRFAFGSVQKLSEAFVAMSDKCVESFGGFRVSDLFPSLKWLPVVTGYMAELVGEHRAADAMLEEIILEHRAKRSGGEAEDLVEILLNMQEKGNLPLPLTMDAIKAVILELFVGGTETPARVVEWIMSEMMRNPGVLRRAQEEVRRVFGGKGRVLEEGLEELKYMKAVIKESLRLHPPAPLIAPRECMETIEVDGMKIPAGTRIIVNVWALGRDPRYWPDAESFYPERFLDSSVDYKGNDFQFLPFGAGRRMCPGVMFGMSNAELALANLLFHFDWKLPVETMRAGDLDMEERFGLIVARKNKLCLIPIPRNGFEMNCGNH